MAQIVPVFAAITNSNLQTLETIDLSLKFDSCRRVDRLKWRQLFLNSELLHPRSITLKTLAGRRDKLTL